MSPEECKAARNALGLTQVAFAQTLGVHSMTVSKWERGKLVPVEDNATILQTLLVDEAVALKTLGIRLAHTLAGQGRIAARAALLTHVATQLAAQSPEAQ